MRKWFVPAILAVLCVAVFTSGCTFQLSRNPASLPTPTILIIPTLHPLPTLVAASTPSSTASIPPKSTPVDFCADPRPQVLINNFKNALQTSNGFCWHRSVRFTAWTCAYFAMASLSTTINKKLNCSLIQRTRLIGVAPSGLETKGSFHDVIVPTLLKVFNKDYTLDCTSAGRRRSL